MSGYFREPEPWEVAGGDGFSDDEDDHIVHSDNEIDGDRNGNQHEQAQPQNNEYELANTLTTPELPSGEGQPGSSPSVAPLLGSGQPDQSPELTFSPLPNRDTSPRRSSFPPLAVSPIPPSSQSQQQSLHRQLRGALGSDNRYPTLPSANNSLTMSPGDLVDLSGSSPSPSFNAIPNPSSLTSDSYFPTLPPTSEFGEFGPLSSSTRSRRPTDPSGRPDSQTLPNESGRVRSPSFPSSRRMNSRDAYF